jgi:hypothetical protein
MVPEARIELARTQGPEDFESDKSHNLKPVISSNYLISLAFFVPKKLGNVRVF